MVQTIELVVHETLDDGGRALEPLEPNVSQQAGELGPLNDAIPIQVVALEKDSRDVVQWKLDVILLTSLLLRVCMHHPWLRAPIREYEIAPQCLTELDYGAVVPEPRQAEPM